MTKNDKKGQQKYKVRQIKCFFCHKKKRENEYKKRQRKTKNGKKISRNEKIHKIYGYLCILGPSMPMDSYEAAQTIFPSIVRPLQKYLRYNN